MTQVSWLSITCFYEYLHKAKYETRNNDCDVNCSRLLWKTKVLEMFCIEKNKKINISSWHFFNSFMILTYLKFNSRFGLPKYNIMNNNWTYCYNFVWFYLRKSEQLFMLSKFCRSREWNLQRFSFHFRKPVIWLLINNNFFHKLLSVVSLIARSYVSNEKHLRYHKYTFDHVTAVIDSIRFRSSHAVQSCTFGSTVINNFLLKFHNGNVTGNDAAKFYRTYEEYSIKT